MKRNFTRILAALALLVGLTIPMGMWGQAPVNTVLWGETWTDGGNAQPSAYGFTGTTVYGNATLTYSNSSTSTKLYNETLAGGTAPELLLAKNNSTWTITGIPSGSATGLTLSFKANYDRTVVSTTTEGVNVGDKTFSNNTVSYPISVTSSVSSFVLVFTNTSGSNVRIDDIQLVVTTAGGGPQLTSTTTTITAPENFNNDLYVGTSAGTLTASVTETNGGAAVSGATVTWSSTNTSVATVDENGVVTLVAVGTTNITATYAGNTTYAPSTGTYQLNVVDNTPFDGMIFTAGTDMGSTTSSGTPDEMTKGNVHIYGSDAAFATAEYRMYKSSTTTISTTDGSTITKIEFINASSNPATGFANQTGWTTNSNGGVWQGEATSVQFVASGAQVRATEIRVSVVANTNPFITVDDVEIAYNATSGSIMAEIGNYVAGTMTAQTEATWITDFSYDQADEIVEIDFTPAENTSPSARTATVTLTYTYGDNQTVSEDVTITQNGNPDLPGGVNNPYTVEQALVAIDDANGEILNGRYATGFVSNIETAYSTQYHNITFDIVDETGNEVFLRAYRCGGDEAADVQVGDSVVVYGNLYYYETGSLYEFAQGCQLISLVHPVSTVPSITFDPDVVNLDAAQHLTLQVPFTYENLEIENYESFAVQFYDTNDEPTTKPDWIYSASVTGTNDEGYNVTMAVISANEGEARSCYFKVYVGETYSNLVTVNQAAYVAPATGNNYALYSGDLVEGDYLIVYNGKAMNNVVVNDRLQYVGVTTNNDVIVMENAEAIWHIAPSGEYWTIYSADANAYAASTGVKNKAQMLTDGTDNKALWTVSGTETYEFVNKHNAANNVNSNLRNNGEYGFACYATGTGGALSLYKRNNDYTPAIAIKGYGESTGGYVLVASPVSTTPVAAGMITDEATDPEEFTFDLYKFDQNANDGLEWRNYRATSFDLVPGEGYLYANKNNVTISFAGTAYNGDGQVPVVAGYNLVGNPYAVAANLSVPYYRLNASGSEVSASTESSAVNAMEGVFVQATEAGSVSFTTSNSGNGKSNAVVMNLSRNRGTVIDNAIVRFDNGRQLPKFQLFENNTKLYIPQGNKDFAIVRSAAQGEMPVSFRASENGTYTIAVEAENVDMNYLHLIDNMTGADVDLLATPNYTFEARTNDYTSRFRLVFSANDIDEQTAETFAFFNGTSWTVSNTGDATLQVVDITGRIVSSETINGNATVSLNQPAGIYMLRLVNGNDVKVQKVVVR